MAERDLTYQDLLEILQLVEESTQFSDFHLKYGDIELELRKHGTRSATTAKGEPPVIAEDVTKLAASPEVRQSAVAKAPALPADGSVIIKSPMVGTFYRASEPGVEPFVSVGQRVESDSLVCILEVMKLMNSIAAGTAGVVTQILVGDGEPVEFGQPLIVIDPKA